MSLDALILILLYFVFLYVLYCRHHIRTSSFLLVIAYFAVAAYSSIQWGVTLPAALLSYTLIITISSILLGNRFAFSMTAIIFTTMLAVGYSESSRQLLPAWKMLPIRMRDVIFYSIMLCIIMLISWLSNRETERSLKRAEQSEKDLQEERDQLEITVLERTEELKQAQAERVAQLYHFAEFGRISSGLFHDLMNPLFSLSLNLQEIGSTLHPELPEIKANLERSLSASQKMNRFIGALKRQIKIEHLMEIFLLRSIIDDVILLLNYKAMKSSVEIKVNGDNEISTFNNPLEFQQIICNLVSNAIDAYEDKEMSRDKKKVVINVSLKNKVIFIEVIDSGKGIHPNIISNIYEPFYSSKDPSKGMGLGLSTTKRLVEKNFNGSIRVETVLGAGTRFIIAFPQTELCTPPSTLLSSSSASPHQKDILLPVS